MLQQSGPSLSSANSDQVPQRYLAAEDDGSLGCRFILVTILNNYYHRTYIISTSSCEHAGDKDRADRSRDRFQRLYHCKGRQGRDERNSHNQNSKRSFIRSLQEPEERSRDILDSTQPVVSAACMTKDQERMSNDIGSGDRGPRQDVKGKTSDVCDLSKLPNEWQNRIDKKLFHLCSSLSCS